MKCYFTGEECDCGGQMDTECPHDEMTHDDVLGDDPDDIDELQFATMTERLDGERVQNS